MVAGLNMRFRVWRFSYPTDDTVGGAVPSGTAVYPSVNGRIQAAKPEQYFLSQGLETPRMFTATLEPATLIIYERDEIEVIYPVQHRYYGKFFRVIGVTESDKHPSDRSGHLTLSLTSSERAHNISTVI